MADFFRAFKLDFKSTISAIPPVVDGNAACRRNHGAVPSPFSCESDYVELKTGTSQRPLQDAIVAFSNVDGGVILIGVQDDGTVVGREMTAGVLDDIHTV